VHAFDPHIDSSEFPNQVTVVEDITTASGFDLVILVTAHETCVNIDWEALGKRMNNPILYDGRRVLDLASISDMGWQVHAVGRPQ
jgi:UDP-N-acetyl-D-mannosaminuronate dehydrogenase